MTTHRWEEDDFRSEVLMVCPAGPKLERLKRLATDLPAVVRDVHDCAAAREALAASPGPDLVISAVTLPDGNWECLLRAMVADGEEGSLVVAADGTGGHFRDELAARGAYGPISEPFDDEAMALLRDAWCEGRTRRLSPKAPTASP